MSDTKKLVAYFSAGGVTAAMAETVAAAAGAELFEIRPAAAYTAADLNWNDKHSRSTVEMSDLTARPAMADKAPDMSGFDVVLIGFPIWWYTAPRIISSFLDSCDLSGKTVALFATSGGSGLGKTEQTLRPQVSASAKWLPGKRLGSRREAEAWVKSLGL